MGRSGLEAAGGLTSTAPRKNNILAEISSSSSRARTVYDSLKKAVLQACHAHLDLYIDVHQNGRRKNIEVATVGISREEAADIKMMYRKARDRVLKNVSGPAPVNLLIEPVDAIEIEAWPAKAEGILGVAKKSLHFELPVYGTLDTAQAREAYAYARGPYQPNSSFAVAKDADRLVALARILMTLQINIAVVHRGKHYRRANCRQNMQQTFFLCCG